MPLGMNADGQDADGQDAHAGAGIRHLSCRHDTYSIVHVSYSPRPVATDMHWQDNPSLLLLHPGLYLALVVQPVAK